LVVGTEWVHGPGGLRQSDRAAGIVYEAIAERYKVTFGTGAEDPSDYDLVVFDGNDTTPDALHKNPAPANFLAAGKAVVILNNTEDHRRIGLNHILWAHAQGSSPAVAFFIPRDRRGVPRLVVQIDFPVDLNTLNTTTPPTADQIAQDAKNWLATLRSRLHAVLKDTEPNAQDAEPSAANAGASILTPTDGTGQTALTLGDTSSDTTVPTNGTGQTALTVDQVVSRSLLLQSAWDTVTADLGTVWCPNSTCDASAPPPVVQTTVTYNIENMLSVLLEPNGGSYQHKIIARQYLLMSPPEDILASNATIKCGGAKCQIYSLLGFNAASTLQLIPSGFPTKTDTGALTLTETMPGATNNVTSLSTSESHTETVGVSATAGYAQGSGNGGSGSVSGNWSDSWGWEQTSTIDISDWSSQSSEPAASDNSGPSVIYTYQATGGTNDTYANLAKYQYPTYDCNQCLVQTPLDAATQFNALQQSGMTSASETTWTSDGAIPPAQYTLAAIEEPQFAEAYTDKNDTSGTPPSYGYLPPVQSTSTFYLDFTDPTLQPPAAAPWTLSFVPLSSSSLGSDYVQTTGTVTLSSPSSSATQIGLSYVIQPQDPLQTLPSEQVCPGNTSGFNPGNNVVSNGSPPFTITIPAGQTQATFPLYLQTFNTYAYNVQVVSWQLTGNLQAAWCLTVPNTP
jgi:hypothetical protein